MSDVAFTVPGTVQGAELPAADTHLSTRHLPLELPPNTVSHATPTDSGHRGLGHYGNHRSVIRVMSEMC